MAVFNEVINRAAAGARLEVRTITEKGKETDCRAVIIRYPGGLRRREALRMRWEPVCEVGYVHAKDEGTLLDWAARVAIEVVDGEECEFAELGGLEGLAIWLPMDAN